MKILGFYSGHDPSYCILEDGIPIIHEELERITRIKEGDGCGLKLALSRIPDILDQVDYVVCAKGDTRYIDQASIDMVTKNPNIKNPNIKNTNLKEILEISHHVCHAANARYTSGFDLGMVITIDGGGISVVQHPSGFFILPVSATASVFDEESIKQIYQGATTSENLGDLWNQTTCQVFGLSIGAPVGNQCGTIMAMATMGSPKHMGLFNATMERVREHPNYKRLRRIAQVSEQDAYDVAASLQKYTEIRFFDFIEETIQAYKDFLVPPYCDDSDDLNLCLSGGVTLNCVMVGKIKSRFPEINNIFCDPVPPDAGLSIGAARSFYHNNLKNPIIKSIRNQNPYLGFTYSKNEVEKCVAKRKDEIIVSTGSDKEILDLLEQQNIVAVFGGGSESGRRALGNRSLLADPRSPTMKDIINKRVKHRQEFRPFAPSILKEDVGDWFEEVVESPYMSFAVPFKEEVRSLVPAVVHYDGTGRLQTVDKRLNLWFHEFLTQWKDRTGVPILLNTSFNDREPIVETPTDAINTFLKTDIDCLYFYDYGMIITKQQN